MKAWGHRMAGSAKKGDVKPGAVSIKGSRNLPGPQEPALDRVTQSHIGDRLRSMYGELIDQPVPDRLADLLRQLDSKT